MKFKLAFVLVVVVVMFASVFLSFRGRPTEGKPIIEARRTTPPPAARPIESTVVNALGKLEAAQTLPQRCQAAMRNSWSLALDRLAGIHVFAPPSGGMAVAVTNDKLFYKAIEPVTGAGCDGVEASHPLRLSWAAMQQACTNKTSESAQKCFEAVFNFRLISLEWATDGVALHTISDVSLLMSKVMARTMLSQTRDLNKAAEAAERVLEIDGENKDAAKYALQCRYLAYQEATDPDKKRAALQALEQGVEKWSRLGLDDEMAAEIRMGIAAPDRSPGEVRKAALAELDREPASRAGAYYNAWASYLDGDASEALALVQKQVQRDPADLKANATLQLLQNPALREAAAQANPFFERVSMMGGLAFLPK